MFFGIPLVLIVFKREVKIYADRIEIHKPVINSTKTYALNDLINWRINEFNSHNTRRQTRLILKFRKRKLEFNKIELSGFEIIRAFLENDYPDKKI